MYKVYIEISKDDMGDTDLINLANNLRQEFLKQDNVIVYIQGSNIDGIDFNAYIKLQLNDIKGPEVQVDDRSKVSNGLAKEVYKELQKIYYDKSIDNGVTYVVGLTKNEFPFIVINIISKNDKQDRMWLSDNSEDIARAICDGTMKSFGLKQC